MTDREIMRQALDALEVAYGVSLIEDIIPKDAPIKQAITALRTAIEQAEKQEPVAWLYLDAWGTLKLSQIIPPPVGAFPVYTTPLAAPREWVGLTDEEFDLLVPYCGNEFDLKDYKDFARAIEAKLKEKNT
jgi:hypothetical protein